MPFKHVNINDHIDDFVLKTSAAKEDGKIAYHPTGDNIDVNFSKAPSTAELVATAVADSNNASRLELRECKREILDLSMRLESIGEKYEKLEQKLYKKKTAIAQRDEITRALEDELKKRDADLLAVRGMLDKLASEAETLEKDNTELQKKLAAAEGKAPETVVIEKHDTVLQDLHAELEKNHAALTEQHDSIKEAHERVSQDHANLREMHDATKETMKSMEMELTMFKNKELVENQGKETVLKEDHNASIERLSKEFKETLDKKMKEMQDKIDTVEKQLEEARESHGDQMEELINRHKGEFAIKKEEYDSTIKDMVNVHKDRIDELTNGHEEWKNTTSNIADKVETELVKKTEELEIVQAELKQLKMGMVDKTAGESTLREGELAVALKKAEKERDKSVKELEDSKKKFVDINHELDMLKQEKQLGLIGKGDNKTDDKVKMMAIVEDKIKTIQEMETQHHDLETHISDLEIKIDRLTKDNANLEEDVKHADEEAIKAEDQVRTMRKIIKEHEENMGDAGKIQKDLDIAIENNGVLESQIKELEKEREEATEELIKALEDMEHMTPRDNKDKALASKKEHEDLLNRSKREMEMIRSHRDELADTAATHETKAIEYEKRLKFLESKAEQKSGEDAQTIELLTHDRDMWKQRAQRLDTDFTNAQTTIQEVHQQLKNQHDESEKLSKELLKAYEGRAKLAGSKEDAAYYASEMKRVQQEHDALKEQSMIAQKQQEEHEGKLTDVHQSLKASQEQMRTHAKELSKTNTELAKSRAETRLHKEDIEKLEQDVKDTEEREIKAIDRLIMVCKKAGRTGELLLKQIRKEEKGLGRPRRQPLVDPCPEEEMVNKAEMELMASHKADEKALAIANINLDGVNASVGDNLKALMLKFQGDMDKTHTTYENERNRIEQVIKNNNEDVAAILEDIELKSKELDKCDLNDKLLDQATSQVDDLKSQLAEDRQKLKLAMNKSAELMESHLNIVKSSQTAEAAISAVSATVKIKELFVHFHADTDQAKDFTPEKVTDEKLPVLVEEALLNLHKFQVSEGVKEELRGRVKELEGKLVVCEEELEESHILIDAAREEVQKLRALQKKSADLDIKEKAAASSGGAPGIRVAAAVESAPPDTEEEKPVMAAVAHGGGAHHHAGLHKAAAPQVTSSEPQIRSAAAVESAPPEAEEDKPVAMVAHGGGHHAAHHKAAAPAAEPQIRSAAAVESAPPDEEADKPVMAAVAHGGGHHAAHHKASAEPQIRSAAAVESAPPDAEDEKPVMAAVAHGGGAHHAAHHKAAAPSSSEPQIRSAAAVEGANITLDEDEMKSKIDSAVDSAISEHKVRHSKEINAVKEEKMRIEEEKNAILNDLNDFLNNDYLGNAGVVNNADGSREPGSPSTNNSKSPNVLSPAVMYRDENVAKILDTFKDKNKANQSNQIPMTSTNSNGRSKFRKERNFGANSTKLGSVADGEEGAVKPEEVSLEENSSPRDIMASDMSGTLEGSLNASGMHNAALPAITASSLVSEMGFVDNVNTRRRMSTDNRMAFKAMLSAKRKEQEAQASGGTNTVSFKTAVSIDGAGSNNGNDNNYNIDSSGTANINGTNQTNEKDDDASSGFSFQSDEDGGGKNKSGKRNKNRDVNKSNTEGGNASTSSKRRGSANTDGGGESKSTNFFQNFGQVEEDGLVRNSAALEPIGLVSGKMGTATGQSGVGGTVSMAAGTRRRSIGSNEGGEGVTKAATEGRRNSSSSINDLKTEGQKKAADAVRKESN